MIHNVPLWFVTCLFVVQVLYYYISKLKTPINLAICVLFAVIGHFMLNNNIPFDFTKLPWNIEAAASALLFYGLGNIFNEKLSLVAFFKWCDNSKIKAIFIYLFATALFVVGALFNGHISLGSNTLGRSTTLLYIVGLLGVLSCLLFSFALSKIKSKLLSLLTYVGKNSFYYMAVHVPIKGFVIVILAKVIKESTTYISENIIWSLLVFGVTLIASTVVVQIINIFLRKLKKVRGRI